MLSERAAGTGGSLHDLDGYLARRLSVYDLEGDIVARVSNKTLRRSWSRSARHVHSMDFD